MSVKVVCDVCDDVIKGTDNCLLLSFESDAEAPGPSFAICGKCLGLILAQRTDGQKDLREIAKQLVLAAFQDAVA